MWKKWHPELALLALIAFLAAPFPAMAELIFNKDGAAEIEPAEPEQVEKWARAGINYFHGGRNIIQQDYEKAHDFLIKAARHDHPEALYYLATMYYDGLGVEEDEEVSEALYRRAAEHGQPDSQMLVGVTHILDGYMKKPGSEEESAAYAEAAKWMKPAAEAGIAEAQFWYGDMLLKGTGIEKDEQKGIELIREAAEKGNPNGQTTLGIYYWLGMGVEQDPVAAYQWLLLGKRSGNSNAGTVLYQTVRVTDEQKNEAIRRANAWQTAFESREEGGESESERPSISEELLKKGMQ